MKIYPNIAVHHRVIQMMIAAGMSEDNATSLFNASLQSHIDDFTMNCGDFKPQVINWNADSIEYHSGIYHHWMHCVIAPLMLVWCYQNDQYCWFMPFVKVITLDHIQVMHPPVRELLDATVKLK